MRYFAGKGFIGKEISVILKKIMEHYSLKNYLEPFCGALGVARNMKLENEQQVIKYYCNDIDTNMILLWNAVKNKEFKNPHITYNKWKSLKFSVGYSAEKAFAGYGCSFAGIYFKGYIKDLNNDNIYKNLYKHDLSFLKFLNKDYKNLTPLVKNGGFLIYCDPPYRNTECRPFERAKDTNFDSDEFWNIVRLWKKMGNVVVISEFTAPKDFKCIWKKQRQNRINPNIIHKEFFYEKLFM